MKTIDSAYIREGGFSSVHDGDTFRYTVRGTIVLLSTVEGRLAPIEGRDLSLLRDQFGFEPELRIDLAYPESEVGGSPDMATVLGDIGSSIGAGLAEVVANWVGQQFGATLEPVEEVPS